MGNRRHFQPAWPGTNRCDGLPCWENILPKGTGLCQGLLTFFSSKVGSERRRVSPLVTPRRSGSREPHLWPGPHRSNLWLLSRMVRASSALGAVPVAVTTRTVAGRSKAPTRCQLS